MNLQAELQGIDRRHVWHPFTPASVWMDEDFPVIQRGSGSYLYDSQGRAYLDGTSSVWVNVHGHGHPVIVEAIIEQTRCLQHSTFLGLSHAGAIELAQRLIEISPGHLSRVFFSENGASAVEVALKMAYSYWRNKGSNRTKFVHLADAYHGDTLGAVSVGGIDRFHETYRPLLFDSVSVANPYRCDGNCSFECMASLEEALGQDVAAVIIEPLVQGAGGIITAPAGHVKYLAELVRSRGTLLIADEVATGFGRTGKMFACDHDGIEPDLMTLGKGITGGYLPMSATLATEAIYETFLGRPEEQKTLYHGHSYSANPITCAAALANLDVFEAEQTLDKLQPKIELLARLLKPIADNPAVAEVRQSGFMVGIDLGQRDQSQQTGAAVARAAQRHGAIIRPLGDVVVLMPPLSINEGELQQLVEITAGAIDAVCR